MNNINSDELFLILDFGFYKRLLIFMLGIMWLSGVSIYLDLNFLNWDRWVLHTGGMVITLSLVGIIQLNYLDKNFVFRKRDAVSFKKYSFITFFMWRLVLSLQVCVCS